MPFLFYMDTTNERRFGLFITLDNAIIRNVGYSDTMCLFKNNQHIILFVRLSLTFFKLTVCTIDYRFSYIAILCRTWVLT